MSVLYRIDGLPLSEGEERLHAQFLRSAKSLPSSEKKAPTFNRMARESYDYADAMLREFRRRVALDGKPRGEERGRAAT